MKIKQALVMAAGFATRMRPLTDDLPKPLIQVCDKSLLDYIIDHLLAEGVTTIVINGYHAIDKLRAYITAKQDELGDVVNLILSQEDDILETGGGAVLAMQYLDQTQPFYMVNGDAFWLNPDGDKTSLQSLSADWDDKSMDMMLLVQHIDDMPMTDVVGDYHMGDDGAMVRATAKDGAYMFTGIRLCHPRVLSGYNVENFSFLRMMDAAQQDNRLYGQRHKGQWYHLSTPQDVDEVNAYLSHANCQKAM